MAIPTMRHCPCIRPQSCQLGHWTAPRSPLHSARASHAPDKQAKRVRLAAGLAGLGLTVLPTQGSYFISTDFRPLGFNGDDVAFCRHITDQAKLTAISVSAFYDGPGAPSHYTRFAFCKRDEAMARLRWRAVAHVGIALHRRVI